jgi:hypothetical protein
MLHTKAAQTSLNMAETFMPGRFAVVGAEW